jgi:hypothetical protein
MVALFAAAVAMMACKTVPLTGECPELPKENCVGAWACEQDRRGCEICVCSPSYRERVPVEDYLTPQQYQ